MNDTQQVISAADLAAGFDDWSESGSVSVWDGKVKWFRRITEVDVIEDNVVLRCYERGQGRPVLLVVALSEQVQIVRS